MAVPQAVRERMQRDEAALREQGIDPNGAPPALTSATVPTQAPAAPAPLASAPIDDAAALRAENERLKAELATQGGRVSATASEVEELRQRFELINSNRTFLESSLTELQAKHQQTERELAEARSAGDKSHLDTVVKSLDESGPTEDQLKEYGDSRDFVERIVQQRMAAALKPMYAQLKHMEGLLGRVKDIDAKIPLLEKSAQVADINVARQREEQFLRAEILPHFPDFESVRTKPEWKTYLSSDTGRGYPVGVLLKTYREQGDAAGIRSILGAFYDKRTKPTLDSLAVPAKTTADAPPTPAAPKMKASEYKANLRAFTSKKMPRPEWDAYRARWDEAVTTGNVEMDAEIR